MEACSTAAALHTAALLSGLVLGRANVNLLFTACLLPPFCLLLAGNNIKYKQLGLPTLYIFLLNKMRLHFSLSFTISHDSLSCISKTLSLMDHGSARPAALFGINWSFDISFCDALDQTVGL